MWGGPPRSCVCLFIWTTGKHAPGVSRQSHWETWSRDLGTARWPQPRGVGGEEGGTGSAGEGLAISGIHKDAQMPHEPHSQGRVAPQASSPARRLPESVCKQVRAGRPQ